MSFFHQILVVERDNAFADFLSTLLSENAYSVRIAPTGHDALSMLSCPEPALVLLSAELSDMAGIDVIKAMRQRCGVPIIVLSARTGEAEAVEVLDVGADDYIVKPFGTLELLARIRVALRHGFASSFPVQTGTFVNGGLSIDYDRRIVSIDGQAVHLTQNEYKLVTLTAAHLGRVLGYDFLIHSIWGSRPAVNNQILRVNMANIRRKIEQNPAKPQYIITETGVGYRMLDCSRV